MTENNDKETVGTEVSDPQELLDAIENADCGKLIILDEVDRGTGRTDLALQAARRAQFWTSGRTSSRPQDDGDEWTVEQQSLDGGKPDGQSTLDGGISKGETDGQR
jgi:hypothetical protein